MTSFKMKNCYFLPILVLLIAPMTAFAQPEYEREPVRYSKTEPTDLLHQLGERLASGETKLEWDQEHGYLKSLLDELKVPVSSQTLVFSKTSLQFANQFVVHQPVCVVVALFLT